MERDTKYFVLLLFLLITSSAILGLNQFYQIKNLENSIANLNSRFESTADAHEKNINVLDTGLYELSNIVGNAVENFQSSIYEVKEEQDLKFGSLSGQLKKVEEKSKDLETQILNIDVTSQGFSEIIEDVIDSVVSIRTDKGLGSGAIIDSEGYVVTNYHVIDGISAALIYTYEGSTYPVSLVGIDKNRDLAVLKIISNKTFEKLKFGDSDDLRVGEKVIALGNPAGLDFTVTEGIISALNRADDNGKLFIQTDVTINPGNSGGPLINSAGRIIGINTFKVGGQYEGLGFAIPSNDVEDIVMPLINNAK